MSNDKANAITTIRQFLTSDDRVLFLNGTHQYEKHKLVLEILLGGSHSFKVMLFRANSKDHISLFLKDVNITKAPTPGRVISINGKNLYADTINPSSWRNSPAKIDVGIVYPVDSLDSDRGDRCLADLGHRGAKKIFLVSWTDNFDVTWIMQKSPIVVTYDAEIERPDYHERVLDTITSSEGNKYSLIPGLPAYAVSTDPRFLVRLHCDQCNKTRWAKLNKPYPGIEQLRSTQSGEYKATCLKCGSVQSDNYNWYNQK